MLSGLRLPFAPALPWVSEFPETNVRTYVKGPDGERGVWFFTLEADRLAAVTGARVLYGLPYRWSKMSVRHERANVVYQSQRKWPFGAGETDIEITPGERMQTRELDHFLTARYRLYTMRGGRLFFAQIEHEPWSLYNARICRLDQNLIEQSGVPSPLGVPLVHHSPDLRVRIGVLQRFPRAIALPKVVGAAVPSR